MANLFQMPADGWVQIAAMGEFPHKASGKVQIIDARACAEMVDAFTQAALAPNFGGVLIDQDHFSLDPEKSSEAMGWITALDARDDGLWAQVRWTDSGRAAVEGGRYRFISPVWTMADCAKLGEKQIRPRRLKNCALTNDPNIKGMAPLSNRAAPEDVANRAKKKVDMAGLTIHIDRPAGYVQRGKDATGAAWERTYTTDYGYIPRTNGGDDEGLDVFTGPNPEAPCAYCIEQHDGAGAFDELKLMLGFDSEADAVACYDAHIPQKFRGPVHTMPAALVQSLCNCKADSIKTMADAHKAVVQMVNRRRGEPLAGWVKKPEPTPPPPRPIVSNRAARAIGRASLAARGVYIPPGGDFAIINRGAMTDDQRRAMFARMSAGGAAGSGHTSASDLPSEVAAADASTSAPATSSAPSSAPDPFRQSIAVNDGVRESAARVALRKQNIEALEATRTAAPAPAKRDLVDTRALRAELMKQGKGPNEILEALRKAESENAGVKQTAAALRAMARRAYPGRPDKQKKYIDDFLQEQDDAFQKALAAWKRDDDKISRAIVKEKVAISEEEIRAREEMNRSAVRQMKMDASAEARAATEAGRLERQQAAIRADVEKRAAAAAATKARDEYKAAEAAAQAGDPVRRAKADKAKRALYWGEVAAGNVAAAAALFPQANTADNAAQVKSHQDALSAADDDTKARATHRTALALITTKQP